MKTILAAVDNSDFAQAVMQRAVQLASLMKADIAILSVVTPGFAGRDTMTGEDKLASFHRQLIYKCFPPDGVTVECASPPEAVYRATSNGNTRIESKIEHGDPVDKICEVAERMKAELVIVGSRGLGEAGTFVLGSVSENVLRKCSRSVIVVKGEGPNHPGQKSEHI